MLCHSKKEFYVSLACRGASRSGTGTDAEENGSYSFTNDSREDIKADTELKILPSMARNDRETADTFITYMV